MESKCLFHSNVRLDRTRDDFENSQMIGMFLGAWRRFKTDTFGRSGRHLFLSGRSHAEKEIRSYKEYKHSSRNQYMSSSSLFTDSARLRVLTKVSKKSEAPLEIMVITYSSPGSTSRHGARSLGLLS